MLGVKHGPSPLPLLPSWASFTGAEMTTKINGAWQPIETAPYNTAVLVQHVEDLYPVTAYRLGDKCSGDHWMRETEGPEDAFYGGDRHGFLYREPTHWQSLPESPAPEDHPHHGSDDLAQP